MIQPSLTLYIGAGCPYCARVLAYLEKNPMKIEIKDVWSDPTANAELLALTGGRTQVPCLKINNSFMHESLDIIEKLKEMHRHLS